MNELAHPMWVEMAGLVGGALGVAIAVWLQLIVQREVNPAHVVAFLAFGWFMILVNLFPVLGSDAALMVKGSVYLTLILLEGVLGLRVYRESPEVRPKNVIAVVREQKRNHD